MSPSVTFTSLNSLATSNRISFQQARTALSHLISTGEITSQAYHEYRVITVVKYDDYQGATSQSTSHQQAINKPANKPSTSQATTSKEYIEYIEKEKENNTTPPGCAGFDEFWESYPRKTAKQDALKAWKSIRMNEGLLAKIMAGLERWKHSEQWNRDGGQYVPYPATWLRGKRWEDEIAVNDRPREQQQPRPEKRINTGANFEQRDYSSVPDDDMARLAAEMAEFKRREKEGWN